MSALVDERECLNERILFFNALQLLGFDACEQRRQHRVEFGADMFCKSNPRGLLVVLHFLFAAKDPEETKKVSSMTARLAATLMCAAHRTLHMRGRPSTASRTESSRPLL